MPHERTRSGSRPPSGTGRDGSHRQVRPAPDLRTLRGIGGGECIFCAIATGSGPAEIVDSDEHTISFMDINPATPGHALVIPRRHAEDLIAISDDDAARTMVAARRLALRMEQALGADGYNILNACRPAAWQTVFHYHVHVIPRYEDDPLHLPWIPRDGSAEEIARIAARIRHGA